MTLGERPHADHTARKLPMRSNRERIQLRYNQYPVWRLLNPSGERELLLF